MVRKGLSHRIGNHLNSRGGNGSGEHSRSASPVRQGSVENSKPLILKVNVIKGRNLAAKDRGGTSDPYLVVTLGNAKQSTPTINKTLNPEWKTCFDMPLTDIPLFECVCWDRDRFGKDYMGEFDIAVEEIFANGQLHQEPKWYKLKSRRKGTKKSSEVSGEVQIQFSLVDAANPAASPEEIYQKFRATVLAADVDSEDGMSRIPRHDAAAGEDTDAELDNEDAVDGIGKDEETSDETEDQTKPESEEKKKKRRLKMLRRKSRAIRTYEFTGKDSDVSGIIFLEIGKITDLPPEKNMTRMSFDMDPFVVISLGRKVLRTKVVRHNLNPVYNEKMVLQLMRHETAYSINFTVMDRDTLTGNDFIASTNLPVQRLLAAAPEADTKTGLYKLQEPVEPAPSPPKENRSRFRLPISRSTSSSSLSKLTRPSLKSNNSQNSLSSSSQLDLQDRGAGGLAPSSTTLEPPAVMRINGNGEGEAAQQNPEDPDMQPIVIPLTLKNKERWEDKHSPELYITAKYLPYRALRQQFWRALLKQYDADDSGRVSKIELTTMLDTLGSTLKESTIDSFFTRFAQENQSSDCLDLTFDQAVICLEEQLLKNTQKASLGQKIGGLVHRAHEASLANGEQKEGLKTTAEGLKHDATNAEPNRVAIPIIELDASGVLGEDGSLLNDDLAEDGGEEHVIEIRECPLCHQPRMGKRTDADIITHIATCASSDWRQVNNLVMGGFVTSSQAQRKWYSKVITKISYGGYKLGANSANILVQDRITGQINEERMSVYVRLGIRLLYKALGSREMEKKRIRKMLRSLSFKQGRKYDDPVSASQIEAFVAFHQLDLSEVLLPLEQFRNFNDFFYRALKPDARPCSAPDDPRVIVSPADCRTVVFDKMEDATRIWVKGRDYSIEKLLGDAYPLDAKRYKNGALGIFRLAPQDYHRFHIPVDGILGTPKPIEGEYYTVNPMAIRSALDVYGENVRVVVPIDSVAHGRVMVICVGAMMVGSTVITRKAGQKVKRAEELGYFKFGGSTILLLFESGTMKFDDDLVENSKVALETLVRVGMSIGHHPSSGAYTPDMKKDEENITVEDRQEAKRRIEGSLAADRP